MTVLADLWELAAKIAARSEPAAYAFEPIGLIMVRPMVNYGYPSTPPNSITFAHTGGDGVHFSLLTQDEAQADAAPVVMTVPMSFGRENLVLGENIREFLSLGCETGYFLLEQLTYEDSRHDVLRFLSHPNEWFQTLPSGGQPTVSSLLSVLREGLGLTPWVSIEDRLMELRADFGPLVAGPTAPA